MVVVYKSFVQGVLCGSGPGLSRTAGLNALYKLLVSGGAMNDDDRDSLIRAHFQEYNRLIVAAEKAKEARLSLLRRLRAADPDYYTQDRLADLSGMSQQNVSYLLSVRRSAAGGVRQGKPLGRPHSFKA
ncbi:hypothetical protein [Nocardia heshunensis]